MSTLPGKPSPYDGMTPQQLRDYHEPEFLRMFSVHKKTLLKTLIRQHHAAKRRARAFPIIPTALGLNLDVYA